MGIASFEHSLAFSLPDGDIIRVLLEQHTRIRDLFDELTDISEPSQRRGVFNELRALMAVHETAEELVLRPATRSLGARTVADARDAEEKRAIQGLTELEELDTSSPEFATLLESVRENTAAHTNSEEHEEFPLIRDHLDIPERVIMGSRVVQIEALAPSRAHPDSSGTLAAQLLNAPMTSLVHHVRHALAG